MRLGRMTAAAAAVFVLGILFQYFNTRSEEGLMQRIVVPMGQRVNLQLADGTDVLAQFRQRIHLFHDFFRRATAG